MPRVSDVTNFLSDYIPLSLAEGWDNVGLLVGDRRADVTRVMTCLTLTPITAAAAIMREAELVVSHHPLPFRPIERLTTDTDTGRILLDLAAARIAVYSPHTAFDSAAKGINAWLAERLGLRGIAPLIPRDGGEGAGRMGWFPEPTSLEALAACVKEVLSVERVAAAGSSHPSIRTLAVACGAADAMLDVARQAGCDALLLGEARFHTCLAAEAANMALLMPGHYASERFAMVALAEVLAGRFPDIEVWASHREHDPIRWL